MSNGSVMAGPFRSMKYVDQSVGSVYLAKILGTYERELHGVIEQACRGRFDRVIDIGAAEGYYAVGLAFRCPESCVIAFETEQVGRRLLQELASKNQVAARVQIQGHCTPETLSVALTPAGRSFVLIDAEGAEAELLDPVRVPALRGCAILVELHEHVQPGIGRLLRTRFGVSHSIEEIAMRPRCRSDLSDQSWPFWWWYLSFTHECRMHEGRPVVQSWLHLEPKESNDLESGTVPDETR